MFDAMQLIPLVPELLVCISAIVLLMVGAFKGHKVTTAVSLVAVLVLMGACYLVMQQPQGPVAVFHAMFRSDSFTQYAKLLMLFSSLMVLIITVPWLQREETRKFEYPVLFLFAVLGLMLMISANDLLSLYVALELASLSLYVMAAFDRDNVRASEAGLKYFVLGSLASGMMLFGSSLIYGFAGTTNFEVLSELLLQNSELPLSAGLIVGLVMLAVGFCFKISAVPFHMWTPDVYEGAPTPVVTFFAVAPKIAALILFTRVLMQPFESMLPQWQQVIWFASVASMLVGAFGALRQTNIKRLLAYSSIGHVGYALVGLTAGTAAGAQSMLIYLSLYIFMSIGAFGFVMLMKRDDTPVEDIAELGGLSKTSPRSALFMAIMMFSMAGIPPLAGFFGKMYVFLAALEQQLYGLVIVGLLSSVIAAYYYLKVVKVMYFDEAKDSFDGRATASSRVVLGLCALVTVLFFVTPTPLIDATAAAVAVLAQ